jgi:hypothetical protein
MSKQFTEVCSTKISLILSALFLLAASAHADVYNKVEFQCNITGEHRTVTNMAPVDFPNTISGNFSTTYISDQSPYAIVPNGTKSTNPLLANFVTIGVYQNTVYLSVAQPSLDAFKQILVQLGDTQEREIIAPTTSEYLGGGSYVNTNSNIGDKTGARFQVDTPFALYDGLAFHISILCTKTSQTSF